MRNKFPFLFALSLLIPFNCSSQASAINVPRDENLITDLSFTFSISGSCFPYNAEFINTSVGYVNFKWSFGDGNQFEGVNASHAFPTPGKYWISIRGKNKSTSKEETYGEWIEIGKEFILTPNSVAFLCKSNPITLKAGAEGTRVEWSTGESKNEIQVNKPGIYKVKMTNSTGCSFTDSLYVDALRNDGVEFSRNTTRSGDCPTCFWARTSDPSKFELSIFDRWGRMVYTTKDPNFEWCGEDQKAGYLHPEGTYVYYLDTRDCAGDDVKMNGTFYMIR